MSHYIVSALLLFHSLVGFTQRNNSKSYTIEQATSDRAQLHTIAFDGLAFMTGNFGASTFFPPGKVADFFGFQYMRDNDQNSMGHNTDFLTRIASNMLSILNPEQLTSLMNLAKEQEGLYTDFAKKRWSLIRAFEECAVSGTAELDRTAVENYCADLYLIDGQLSYRRAQVMGGIIRSFTDAQKKQFDLLKFENSSTWPDIPEPFDKRLLSHRAHVGLMTYASELFSWYKGSLMADIYFCPERHGTYFGGFYMKDYPAMDNHGYNIPTSLTGESGKTFLELLTTPQRVNITSLPELQKKELDEIVRIRTELSTDLRLFITGKQPDQKKFMERMRQYGQLDGTLSYLYATAFARVRRTLTSEQMTQLNKLRNQNILPKGVYLYSDPMPLPEALDVSGFFQTQKKAF